MMRMPWSALTLAAALASVAPALRIADAAAQVQPPRTLDIGGPPGDSLLHGCPDSIVTAALAVFNSPAAVRSFGDLVLGAGQSYGTTAVFHGNLRINGTVQGDVVVIEW